MALIFYPFFWMFALLGGFALIYRALYSDTWLEAVKISGSSLLTLGFAPLEGWTGLLIGLLEAVLGLLFIALFIAYLPTIFGAFARREADVTRLAIRAGTPPNAVRMLIRLDMCGFLENEVLATDLWGAWEDWLVDISSSHTALSSLVFFHSPHENRSWVGAAGVVLDAAALSLTALDTPHDPQAHFTLKTGARALHDLAAFFGLDTPDKEGSQAGTISITRADFDAALAALDAAGVPLLEAREESWHEFKIRRATYDEVLVGLEELVLAPTTPWVAEEYAEVSGK